MSLTFSIIGAGAIGGFYGTRLLRAGYRVRFFDHFCARELQARGMEVLTAGRIEPFKDLEVYDSLPNVPPSDRVIICLKTTQNKWLESHLHALTTPLGVVLTMQNGYGIEADLARAAAGVPIFGALCFVGVRKLTPTRIEHLHFGQISLAEYLAEGRSPCGQLPLIAQELRRTQLPVEEADSLEELRWKKLLWNIPFNGLSVVLNTTVDTLSTSEPGRTMVRELMNEVRSLAVAAGHPVTESFAQALFDRTAHLKNYSTSLKSDYDQKRSMEVETMFQRPVNLAHQLGVAVPRLEFLLSQLNFVNPTSQ
jgi:2-dehydropantoate 2-reductase